MIIGVQCGSGPSSKVNAMVLLGRLYDFTAPLVVSMIGPPFRMLFGTVLLPPGLASRSGTNLALT